MRAGVDVFCEKTQIFSKTKALELSATVEFVNENGGGAGLRLKKRQVLKRS
jgi:hypothetical protein